MNPELTEHAKKRMRQRGISSHTMDIIVGYGRYQPVLGGAIKIFLGNKVHQELVSRIKKDLQILDNAKGGTLILSADGQILTIYKNK
jgi:hypothetical protein